jgi:hypothetical protein
MKRRLCIFTLAALSGACSFPPYPLADDPVKCAIALSKDEPLAQRDTGQSVNNLRSFADYFRYRADQELSPQEQSAKAREANRVLSQNPEVRRSTARACVAQAKRQLG